MSPNVIKTLALRLENRFVWNHPHSLDSRKVAKLWQTEIFKTIFNQTPTLNVLCACVLLSLFLSFLFGGFCSSSILGITHTNDDKAFLCDTSALYEFIP